MITRYDFWLEFDGHVYKFRSVNGRQNFYVDNKITRGHCWYTVQGDSTVIDDYYFEYGDEETK